MGGCVWGIPDAITAVTFVALGTSLPDTFASKTAALLDPYADNSIGNVTGSNSVNVFLGIGLPWMLGAVFWSMQGKGTDRWEEWRDKYIFAPGSSVVADHPDGNVFVVLSGDLGYSVAVFSVAAVVSVGVIALRRLPLIGGELGGPTGIKYATSAFLVMLWFLFVILYIVKVMSNSGPCD